MLAARDAVDWGYPRPIEFDEVFKGAWYRLGEGVVFWYVAAAEEPGLWLHLCVDPEYRLRWPARRWLKEMEAIAIELGADRLRCSPMEEDIAVPNYLTRLGWVPDEYGLCKRLGERYG